MQRSGVEQLLVVENGRYPESSPKVQRTLDVLDNSQWKDKYRVFRTQHADPMANIDELAHEVEDGDTLMPIGGDGMTNTGGGAIILSEMDANLAVTSQGNANDMGYSLFGRWRKRIMEGPHLKNWLEKGQSQTMGGINVEYSAPNEKQIIPVLGSVGLGFSAEVAMMVDDNEFRERRANSKVPNLILETSGPLLQGIKQREPFAYVEDDEQHEAVSMDFVSSQRMAKILKFNHRTMGKEMTCVELGAKNFCANLAIQSMRGAVGALRGESIQDRAFYLPNSVAMQYDGQTHRLPDDADVKFTHVDNMIDVLMPENQAAE